MPKPKTKEKRVMDEIINDSRWMIKDALYRADYLLAQISVEASGESVSPEYRQMRVNEMLCGIFEELASERGGKGGRYRNEANALDSDEKGRENVGSASK